MANPELGTKQVCPHCQAKFYDLGRRPAHCPKCDTEFDPEEAVRSRRVRARTTGPTYEAEEEVAKKPAPAEGEEGFEEADDTPELDEAAEAEPVEADEEDAEPGVVKPAAEPDLGVDFEEEGAEIEAEADVPFLEEEEEDADFPDDELDPPADDEEH